MNLKNYRVDKDFDFNSQSKEKIIEIIAKEEANKDIYYITSEIYTRISAVNFKTYNEAFETNNCILELKKLLKDISPEKENVENVVIAAGVEELYNIYNCSYDPNNFEDISQLLSLVLADIVSYKDNVAQNLLPLYTNYKEVLNYLKSSGLLGAYISNAHLQP